MAVVRGPKACKHQTTMSRLTRVHASVIQSLFIALFPQAAELRWKTIHWLCITHILSGLCSLGPEGIVESKTGGRGKREGEKKLLKSVECCPAPQRRAIEKFWGFSVSGKQKKKKRSKFTVKIISKTWCIGLLQGGKISSLKHHEAFVWTHFKLHLETFKCH